MPFRMDAGFHCPCGGWSVPHSGGVVSDVKGAYRSWGAHVREVFEAPAPLPTVSAATQPHSNAGREVDGFTVV